MTRILFVCLGNICRSPMAESIMTYLAAQRGRTDIYAASAATSTWEIGNGVHEGTRKILEEHHIPLVPHTARVMTPRDDQDFDLLIGMDQANLKDMADITGSADKIHRLLEWSDHPRDIADPWFTHNFVITFDDIMEGCNALLDAIPEEK